MRLTGSSQRLQRGEQACSTGLQRPAPAAPRARCAAPPARAAPCGACCSTSSGPAPQQQQQQRQRQQRCDWRRQPSWVARDAAAPAMASESVDEDLGPSSLGPDAAQVFAYAMQLAWTAETYEVHPWMLLLGILKDEASPASKALGSLGLTDPYAAWHEVLWALNVSNGLEPRAFTYQLAWAPGAYKVANGAVRFAGWAGRDKVAAHDVLLALAAAGSLEGLFPDLQVDFESVRRAVGKAAGDAYRLPGEDPKEAALKNQDLFL